MSIAAVTYSSFTSYRSAPVASASAVKNNGDGLVLETLGKLKISEIDGKNVTSMYGSGPGEGEVLNRVHFGGAEAIKAQDFGGDIPSSVPTAAASFSYQAVSGFGSDAPATTTFSLNS